MTTIELTFQDNIAILKLDRPKGHAINQAMVNEMLEAFQKLADSNTVDGVILASSGSIFCGGLDVVDLFEYSQDEIAHFWETFLRLLRNMIAFPKPLICAINGHAPAGGCVFAMCCDHRIMSYGKARIGLNEVPVGIVVPQFIVELARFTVGNHKASQMFYNGLLLQPEEAKEFGLVDETCKEEELMIWAETKLKKWTDLPQNPWRLAKQSVRKPLLAALDAIKPDEAFRDTLISWWDDENRRQIGKLVAKLSGK
ncbi:MAG: enoyl-CoA hydratase/isomerase family protein [Candidatus Hydrogenedentota bacterium]